MTTADSPDLIERVSSRGGRRAAALVIDVIGFDWNCPKYIEPRFTEAEVDERLRVLVAENEGLRAELARLKGASA